MVTTRGFIKLEEEFTQHNMLENSMRNEKKNTRRYNQDRNPYRNKVEFGSEHESRGREKTRMIKPLKTVPNGNKQINYSDPGSYPLLVSHFELIEYLRGRDFVR